MIGVDAEIVMMPTPEYFQSFYSGQYPFIVNTMTPENGGNVQLLPLPAFAVDGPANTFNVEPPARLEELYQLALAAPEDEQPALLQEMTQIIHDEALDLRLFSIPQAWSTITAIPLPRSPRPRGSLRLCAYKERDDGRMRLLGVAHRHPTPFGGHNGVFCRDDRVRAGMWKLTIR